MADSQSSPLRVAIVGAGPAGFYAAAALLASDAADFNVDIIERLHAPFGLLRYGVAPDHQKIKRVRAVFERTLRDPRVRFLGNVTLGETISRDELLTHYHRVIHATGLQGDRRLGLEHEDARGVLSSTAFVGWYNGHPDYRDLNVPLDHEHAVIVGAGNVALDVARVLSRSPEELRSTDIAEHALDALSRSAIRRVTILARRGPADVNFTNPEIREFGVLPTARATARDTDFERGDIDHEALQDDRTQRRNVEILRSFTERRDGDFDRTIDFRFYESVHALEVSDGRLTGLEISENKVVDDRGRIRVVQTDDLRNEHAGLLIKAIGYQGVPIEGVPFRRDWRTIPCRDGRLLESADGEIVPREYVVGWAGRGASGVIGTNKPDGELAAQALVADHLEAPELPPAPDIMELLDERGVRVITTDDWLRLDAMEQSRGEALGAVRSKFCSLDEAVQALDAAESSSDVGDHT